MARLTDDERLDTYMVREGFDLVDLEQRESARRSVGFALFTIGDALLDLGQALTDEGERMRARAERRARRGQ